jgi:hypothetical protein
MKTIYKYQLKRTEFQLVAIPEYSEILDVQMQNGQPCMWALIDTESDIVEVGIRTVMTGEEMPENECVYLGTVQEGMIVAHFFMEVES